jgi:hypothetical protein
MMIAYIRTRYAVAFYMVIFGSIIVAAYKMGLVHEKRREPGQHDAIISDPASLPPPDPSDAV